MIPRVVFLVAFVVALAVLALIVLGRMHYAPAPEVRRVPQCMPFAAPMREAPKVRT